MTHILREPWWKLIRPYLVIDGYHPSDKTSRRARLELRSIPPKAAAKFLAFTTRCARCGELIFAVRKRHGQHTYYLAVSCPQDHNAGCSRSNEAREAYNTILRNLPITRSIAV